MKLGRAVTGLSYPIGVVALIAAVLDDRTFPDRTFHVRQALLLNVLLGVLASVAYGWYMPQRLMQAAPGARSELLLQSFLPVAVIIVAFVALGFLAYNGRDFRVPGIAALVRRTL